MTETELIPKKLRHARNGGIGINYLTAMLVLLKSEKRSAYVYTNSPYRYKKSTLALIRALLDNHYIIRRYVKKHSRNKTAEAYYSLSFAGEMLLFMLENLSEWREDA